MQPIREVVGLHRSFEVGYDIIDNYDSFTYNLVHLVAEQTNDYRVIRNDEYSLDQIVDLRPTKILLSPGPGKPEDAGVTKQVIAELAENPYTRRLFGASSHR